MSICDFFTTALVFNKHLCIMCNVIAASCFNSRLSFQFLNQTVDKTRETHTHTHTHTHTLQGSNEENKVNVRLWFWLKIHTKSKSRDNLPAHIKVEFMSFSIKVLVADRGSTVTAIMFRYESKTRQQLTFSFCFSIVPSTMCYTVASFTGLCGCVCAVLCIFIVQHTNWFFLVRDGWLKISLLRELRFHLL